MDKDELYKRLKFYSRQQYSCEGTCLNSIIKRRLNELFDEGYVVVKKEEWEEGRIW